MNLPYASLDDLVVWAQSVAERPADFDIGTPGDIYLRRWWVVPRNEMANVYLHQIIRSDDDRALHDHPWDNTSLVLSGSYVEHTPEGAFIRGAGSLISRKATDSHRLEIVGEPVWTLFMTGPKIREWGFHCPNGWVHWQDFTGGEHGEIVGRGCGE